MLRIPPMNPSLLRIVIVLLFFLSGLGPISTLAAQTPSSTNEASETVERLKGIYERGEWRPATFTGKWVADSSGYTIRKRSIGSTEEQLMFVDVKTGEEKRASDTPSPTPLLSPNQQTQLEFREGQLVARDVTSNEIAQLSRNEEGHDIHIHNISWSPDGSHVVFVESDYTEVRERAVLVPGDPTYPGVRQDRFARIGEKIPELKVGVVNRDGSELKWLPLEASKDGFYLGQVEWVGNEEILIEQLSRFRDRRDFLIYNTKSEVVQRIFSETNEAWVTASQGTELGLMWIEKGSKFIVITEKDGWRHAYLYSRDGRELANLTPGGYDIIERAVLDEANGWFYFYASPENATQKYLYRVSLNGENNLQRVTPADQPGTHSYEFSPDAKFAFHTYSTFDKPPVIDLVSLPDHKSIRNLEANKAAHDLASTWVTRPTDFIQLEIDENISLDAWMIKPKDFDSSKKYPLFIYVYGEPHAQTVLDSWAAAQSPFLRVVADLGYVVVSIDNRGTPAPKGAAWRRAIFGSLGPLSTEEQASALLCLGRTYSFIDLERVGIWGWSGGGSNTLNALFRKPDLYHVGIAVVPKPQPHLYNAWFQEIYMRTPAVNPDGYKRSAPLNFANGLKGKLLIITGSGETNTHIQIIEGLVDRLIELGKPFDYMVYPNRDHGLREGRGTEVHVRMLIIRYLMDNLIPGPR